MIFNQTLPARGGGGTHSVTCAEGLYVASQVPDSRQTAEVTEMDFTTGATVYIWRGIISGSRAPVVKTSNGTTIEPTGYGNNEFYFWWSYSMPDYCVIANSTATIATRHVSVDSGNGIILTTVDNHDLLQSEGECVVGALVSIVADDGCTISTGPDTEPWQAFGSDWGVFWFFTMPDSDVVIYEEYE